MSCKARLRLYKRDDSIFSSSRKGVRLNSSDNLLPPNGTVLVSLACGVEKSTLLILLVPEHATKDIARFTAPNLFMRITSTFGSAISMQS